MAELDPLFLRLQESVAGRYSLERELGRGGMGVVFLARDVSLDRPVAIKLLPPGLAARPAHRERFLREARVAARLSHPNIVPIHAVEDHDDLVWFVMAFIPGESLGERLRARGTLPVGEVVQILRDAAYALAHAHGQGVVHRDVKPDNILLESGGRRALLVDFGIAATVEEAGDISGTVAYLSPEQATGDRVDGRSDLYGLGVVGYQALAARLPYPVTRLPELIERQLAGAAPPLAEVAPHVPRALCRAIDRCLAPLPGARFQKGDELAGALEQLGGAGTDLPAPFRVWIQKGERRRNPAAVITLLWGVPTLVGLVAALASGAVGGAGPIFLSYSLLVVGAPWTLVLGVRLFHTRRLLAAGYSHADLVRALEQHVDRRREELAFEHGTSPSRLARAVNVGIIAGGVGAVLGLVGSFLIPPTFRNGPLIAGLCSGGLSLVLAWVRNAVPGARADVRDRAAEFGLRFWKGPVGRWLTRVAGWRLGRREVPSQLLHRPTEVALGEAADALFQALPAAERRDLRELPPRIKELSNQAQHMRRRIEELDDLIARAAPTTLFEGETAAGDGGAGALGEARALWAGRLKETVTMLEGLRLGLLRLHAGSVTPATLTEDLAAARELHGRLDRLLAAREEVDESLKKESS